MTPEEVRDRLGELAVIAVVRARTPDDALAIAHQLLEGGLQAIEITYTVPEANNVIRQLTTHSPALVGAGTIVTSEQLTGAIDSGANFVVSPVNPTFLLPEADQADVLAIPGCATPNEMWRATQAGALAVKAFPAAQLGGPAYLRDLAGPLPDLRVMSSGGIGINDISAYLDAGAWCVGIGSPLAGEMTRSERVDRARRAHKHARR